MRYSDVGVQPLKSHKYRMLTALYYKDIKVPRGYRTNGADIPRLLWWVFPPNDSDILPAVIVHDFLCDRGHYCKADRYFNEIMKELQVSKTKRKILHKAVSLYTKYIRSVKCLTN
jgi:hypothetical protein